MRESPKTSGQIDRTSAEGEPSQSFKKGGIMFGTCINSTLEDIAVYGPKSNESPPDWENALYLLPAGRKTPDNWDCDGIYVPKDRIAVQAVGPFLLGPVAIKYVDVLIFVISQDDMDRYVLPPNQGAFTPNQVCCPSDWPRCVCWNIPSLARNQLNFPYVPGHLPVTG
jgi:hypothetical protein